MWRWQLFKISRQILPLVVLSLSVTLLPSCMTSQPAKPFSSETLPTEAIAEISEIRSYPIRVKYLNASVSRPATVGVSLKVNESVSTEETSTAQVSLRNGTIIRIGGKSSLTLKPQNQVEFTAGRLVAGYGIEIKSTAKVQTPFGEISSDGAVYIEIPAKAAEERRVIALDGITTVLLKGTTTALTLNKGEEIRIKADGKASEPKRIEKESIDKRIANNNLLFGFNTPLANQNQIAAEFGISATVKEAKTIEFRRSDVPKLPKENSNQKKITYTSGSANNDREERRDNSSDRRPEEPTATRNAPVEPKQPPANPAPPTETPPPITPPPVEPPPVTTNPPTDVPPPPTPAQPIPIEPPPAPVQPEIAAPEPPPKR